MDPEERIAVPQGDESGSGGWAGQLVADTGAAVASANPFWKLSKEDRLAWYREMGAIPTDEAEMFNMLTHLSTIGGATMKGARWAKNAWDLFKVAKPAEIGGLASSVLPTNIPSAAGMAVGAAPLAATTAAAGGAGMYLGMPTDTPVDPNIDKNFQLARDVAKQRLAGQPTAVPEAETGEPGPPMGRDADGNLPSVMDSKANIEARVAKQQTAGGAVPGKAVVSGTQDISGYTPEKRWTSTDKEGVTTIGGRGPQLGYNKMLEAFTNHAMSEVNGMLGINVQNPPSYEPGAIRHDAINEFERRFNNSAASGGWSGYTNIIRSNPSLAAEFDRIYARKKGEYDGEFAHRIGPYKQGTQMLSKMLEMFQKQYAPQVVSAGSVLSRPGSPNVKAERMQPRYIGIAGVGAFDTDTGKVVAGVAPKATPEALKQVRQNTITEYYIKAYENQMKVAGQALKISDSGKRTVEQKEAVGTLMKLRTDSNAEKEMRTETWVASHLPKDLREEFISKLRNLNNKDSEAAGIAVPSAMQAQGGGMGTESLPVQPPTPAPAGKVWKRSTKDPSRIVLVNISTKKIEQSYP